MEKTRENSQSKTESNGILIHIIQRLLGLVLVAGYCQVVVAAQPNILLILSDDQAWTDYGFMGHPHIETPNLDRLAAESLTFTRGYVTSPLCRPSLASILTGLPPHLHGTTGNDPNTGDDTIRNMASRSYPRHDGLHNTLYDRLRSFPNFVRLLKEAGYATLQTGKWWESDPRTFGFTAAMTHGDPRRGAGHGDRGLVISRQGISPIRQFLDDCGADGGIVDQPFFIWHAPFLPHSPHNPPGDLLKKYERVAPTKHVASYWAMCEWFDQTCGELFDEFDKRGIAENTLVIYFTDNGYIQHPDKANIYAPRSKSTSYEGGVRTPVMLRWPGTVSPELDSSTVVSGIDLAPTILRAANLEVPQAMPGLDLTNRQSLQERNLAHGSTYPHSIADVNSPARGVESRYLVRGPWKLIVNHGAEGNVELFHLEADPHEETNLATKQPQLVSELRAELDKKWPQKNYQR